MKKAPFIFLLTIELVLGMISMGLLLADLGAICYLIAAVIFAAVLTPFFIKLKKTEDEEKKAKIRRNALLIMLTPIAIALLAVIATVVILIIGIGYW